MTGDNLTDSVDDIRRYNIIVTYNGSCFDIPFIGNSFGIKLTQGQIDLRWILTSLGLKGGLEGCERSLGLDRRELDGVNGLLCRAALERLLEERQRKGSPNAAGLQRLGRRKPGSIVGHGL